MAPGQDDMYKKLKGTEPTPAAELCRCIHAPWKLMSALGIFLQRICEHDSIVTIGD